MLVRDIRPGPSSSFPMALTSVGNTLLFFADDGTHGTELWRSDGTPGGTLLVAALFPGPGYCFYSPTSVAVADGKIFFAADDGVAGPELWESDGTAGGTILREIVPGPVGGDPIDMGAVNGSLYLSV